MHVQEHHSLHSHNSQHAQSQPRPQPQPHQHYHQSSASRNPQVPTTSPLSTTSTPITILQHIHDRYLRVPEVNQWLFARDAQSDFHVVGNETAVLVTTGSNSSPTFVQPSSISKDLPFPSSDDLMFLERVTTNNFACGHVWGSTGFNGHPFSPLAMTMHNHRWQNIRSRKFASDLSVNGAVETVEYTWYHDDSCTVSITRSPFSSNAFLTRISLHLFYTPDDKPCSILHRRASSLFMYDNSMCTNCKTELCSCPDAIAPQHDDHSNCFVLNAKRSDGTPVQAHYFTKLWIDRQCLVSRGSKKGVSTILLNPFKETTQRIGIRQEFFSIFRDSGAISARIQNHLTQMLSKLSQIRHIGDISGDVCIPQLANSAETNTTNTGPCSGANTDGCPPSGICAPNANGNNASGDDTNNEKDNDLQPKNPVTDPSVSMTLPSTSSFGPNVQETCWQSSTPNEDAPSSKGHSLSPEPVLLPGAAAVAVTGRVAMVAAAAAAAKNNNTGRASVGGGEVSTSTVVTGTVSSTCGPEKVGTDCECAAENMRNRALAHILNSRYARLDMDGLEPYTTESTLAQPVNGITDDRGGGNNGSNGGNGGGASSTHANSSVGGLSHEIGGISGDSNSIGHGGNAQTTNDPSKEKDLSITAAATAANPANNLDVNSSGDSTALASGESVGSNATVAAAATPLARIPSPLRRVPSFSSVEPALKRPRPEPAVKADPMGLGLGSSTWSAPLGAEIRDKDAPYSSWGLGSVPPRPLSAIGRALGGIVRTPTPTNGQSCTGQKVSSPSKLPLGEGTASANAGSNTNASVGGVSHNNTNSNNCGTKVGGIGREMDFTTNPFDWVPPMQSSSVPCGESVDVSNTGGNVACAVTNVEKCGLTDVHDNISKREQTRKSHGLDGMTMDNASCVAGDKGAGGMRAVMSGENSAGTLRRTATTTTTTMGSNKLHKSDLHHEQNSINEVDSNSVKDKTETSPGSSNMNSENLNDNDDNSNNTNNNNNNTANSGVQCEICGMTFAKRGNKMRHILTVHNRLKQFQCDLCGAKFGLKADLGRHRYRIHESRSFVCRTCGKSYAEESQLEIHTRTTHEENCKPWECKICHIRFGRKSSLTRHEQTVHQQTRFFCRVCKKSYSQRFDAIRHERKVHGLNDKNGGVVISQ